MGSEDIWLIARIIIGLEYYNIFINNCFILANNDVPSMKTMIDNKYINNYYILNDIDDLNSEPIKNMDIDFIISIQNTNVANTLVMIAMAPMLLAILGSIFLKEVPDQKTWIAIIITLISVTYIFHDSMEMGNFYGDLFGLITAFGLACNAVIARYAKNRDLVPSAVMVNFVLQFLLFFS